MNCDVCKGPMKTLFTGWYCPKDCDKTPTQDPPDSARVKTYATLNSILKSVYAKTPTPAVKHHMFLCPVVGQMNFAKCVAKGCGGDGMFQSIDQSELTLECGVCHQTWTVTK